MGFRYQDGKCQDSQGAIGLNPEYLGECGEVTDQKFEDEEFARQSFMGANLSRSKFIKSDLFRAEFSGANLTGAALIYCDVGIANFADANLTKSDLTYSKFFSAGFYGADLSEARLFWADFKMSDLRNANLETADAEGMYVEEALFNKNTKLPLQWGSTSEERKAEALKRGMIFKAD